MKALGRWGERLTIAFLLSLFSIFGASALISTTFIFPNDSLTSSMYFSCHAGQSLATNTVSFFGLCGSNATFFPFASFFCCEPSADPTFDKLVRMYALVAPVVGTGSATDGHLSCWIRPGFCSTPVQMYSLQCGATGASIRACSSM